ncbi:MAG: EAL domain-containing protein [Chloroflexi bacterium]|nr:MAG: EAL domain-containing protein [Chloroflexota bacterium]MBL1196169.1 EAL domain-containing protein [Chloroflexota bacterium]
MVLKRLEQYIKAPQFADGEKTRVAQALNTIVFIIFTLAIFYLIIDWIRIGVNTANSSTFVMLLIVIGGLKYLLHRGVVNAASWILVLAFWLGIMLASYFTGGTLNPGLATFMALPIIATVLIGARASIVMSFIGIVGVWGLYTLGQLGRLPPSILAPNAFDFAINTTINLALASILLYWTATRLQKAVAQLGYSEARFRDLSNATVEGIVIHEDGVIVDANQSFVTMFGYDSASEIIGKDVLPVLVPADSQELVLNKIDSQFNGIYESILQRKDRSTFPAEIEVRETEHNGRRVRVGAVRDITRIKEVENELRESEERYRQIFTLTHDYAYVDRVEPDGSVTVEWITSGAMKVTDYSFEEMQDPTIWFRMVYPEDLPVFEEHATLVLSGQVDTAEFRIITKNGEIRWLRDSSYPIWDKEQKRVIRLVGAAGDITKRKQAEEALQDSQEQFRALSEASFEAIFLSEEGICVGQNLAAEKMFGYTLIEAIGQPGTNWIAPEDRDAVVQNMLSGHEEAYQAVALRKDGSTFPAELRGKMMRYQGREVRVTSLRDITERKKAEEELNHLATHDMLTGLPNRTLFDDRLSHAIEVAKRKKDQLAVLFLDLDNFKSVNDAFGHKQGDRLLQTIAQRLMDNVRQSDTVARLGGDEFAILLEGISTPSDVLPTVNKILQGVAEPFTLQDAEAFITGSIGISLFPTDGADPDTLIQNADRAMYRSKEEGKNNFRFFSAAMKADVLERLELKNQLRNALERQEFVIHYQPQIDARTGKANGVEALLRWQHPERGILMANDFIALAEETGLIVPIGEWVLETACQQMKHWQNEGLQVSRLAVNLSEREIKRTDLGKTIEAILKNTGLEPDALELELTENILFQDMPKVLTLLLDLKGLGVRLALDDFGTGYSTLGQLAHFPLDTLKIDQHFASHLMSSNNDAAIVDGIITIAKNLGVAVIAEGVEDHRQLASYQSKGCHHIQGWVFSKAKSAEQLETILRDGIQRPQLVFKFE